MKTTWKCKNCEDLITFDGTDKPSNCLCNSPDFILYSTEFEEAELKNLTLAKVHETYKKLLYVEDTNRIDVVLATALSQKLEGIPIWLIIVGASGDMKSVQLNAISNADTYVLHNLTSKTLVNGYADKKKFPDLAPELKDKIIIIPDMAQILKLPPVEKAELWGQLRDLYDGLAGKISGNGSRARYEGIKVTLLAGSTPAIDGQILVHQDLGTRELIYRTSGNANKEAVMNKCFENESQEAEISKTLKTITNSFLTARDITRKDIPEDVLAEIKRIALFVATMRATAEVDSYTDELRNAVYPEEPTRVAKQLKRMYICLKSLDDNYSDEKALEILWHIGESSCFPLRIKIFEFLRRENEAEYTTSKIAELLGLGKKTVLRECFILEALGVIKSRWQETAYPDKFYYHWKVTDKANTIIRKVNKLKEAAKAEIPSPNIRLGKLGNRDSIISGDSSQTQIIPFQVTEDKQ